ncbi:transcription initiation factor TFIIH subunit 2 [Nematocida sp. AWRm80]|nr:transcription initiation factor TFIIH subunit 2 [Nematocida sp. AWRm80]
MENSVFRWEEKFKNTWDYKSQEDINNRLRVNRRTENVRRGIIRKVLLVLDMSVSVEERDMLPSRKWHLKRAVVEFYRAFMESNPLSTMGLMLVEDGAAHLVTPIISDTECIVEALGACEGKGKFSLSAGLEGAQVFFQGCSLMKEIVMLVSSISLFGRCPYQPINQLIEKGVKIHVIHMAGEIDILKKTSKNSGGIFGVINTPEDLTTLLGLICVPVPYTSSRRLSMLKVGFPRTISETSICACHLKLTEHGYECPFCTTKVCSVPGVCPICENILTAAVHLLKALHWIDSAPVFEPASESTCRGCNISYESMYKCPDCQSILCIDCSTFIGQELNFCIFCKHSQK